MNALTYKGYTGVFEYESDDEAFHGTVLGIRDVIHFTGRSIDELKAALADSVEEYLAMCREDGVDPQKPVSGKFALRLDPDVHRKAIAAAKASGKSINAWMAEAIEHRLGDAR